MPKPLTYVDFPVRIRRAEVVRTVRLTPSMLRLTVGGAGAEGFESAIFDEHVKLILPDPESGELRLPTPDGDELDWPRPFPTSREYTVRAHRPADREIDIDFVLHDGGLAAGWVQSVRPGDAVHMAGPPGGYLVGDDYDYYVLVADETALPAALRWLGEMPRSHRGVAYLQVAGPSSEQPVDPPPGLRVVWLHDGGRPGDLLERAARSTEIPAGESVFVWMAGEAGAIKPLRRWVRDELKLTKEHSSITGYWKRGHADTHEHLDDDDEDD